jgi:hypothetical protein
MQDLIRDKDSGRIFNRMNASVTHSGKVIRYVRDKADVNKTIGHVYDHDLRDDDGNVCDPTDVKSAVLITGFECSLRLPFEFTAHEKNSYALCCRHRRFVS